MKNRFICPVCGEKLIVSDKICSCKSGHNFDIARQGYVNLLLSQQSGAKHHGDDKLMVNARRNFLEKGYYSSLRDGLCNAVKENCPSSPLIIDAGCGEGYYSQAIINETNAEIIGIDISKDAVSHAAKRCSEGSFAVASAFNMPVGNEYADAVLNVFAPLAAEEYERVLKPDGILILAVPLENHLLGLKKVVYDDVYLNDTPCREIQGFDLIDIQQIVGRINLDSNEDICNLFRMTPYFYKTGKEDQAKLETIEKLETETEFEIQIYKKKK